MIRPGAAVAVAVSTPTLGAPAQATPSGPGVMGTVLSQRTIGSTGYLPREITIPAGQAFSLAGRIVPRGSGWCSRAMSDQVMNGNLEVDVTVHAARCRERVASWFLVFVPSDELLPGCSPLGL